MKLVFTFCLFLCCYLCCKYGYANRSLHDFNSCGAKTTEAPDGGVSSIAAQNYIRTGGAGLNQENPDLLCVEDEANEYVFKKMLYRPALDLSQVVFLRRHIPPYDYPVLSGRLFYIVPSKYIAQRVLRI